MDYSYILSEEIQNFINNNFKIDSNNLALKFSTKFDNWFSITEQLIGKKKAEKKLPTWFSTKNIIYPKSISVEQSSSEQTAKYKASIVSGESLVDLTGGFGVDDYYFSRNINNVTHCEINQQLSDLVKHNFVALEVNNINCINLNSSTYIKECGQKWDWIFIDPARRDDAKGKVFLLEDCTPNIIANLNGYLAYTNNILIKTSPILDITSGIRQLPYIKSIHVVAVNNEVKELLWEVKKNHQEGILIHTANITKDKTDGFEFEWNTGNLKQDVNYSLPQQYLYEPNAAIMKSGGFYALGAKYNLKKLHEHTQLFTSNTIINFPGRTFTIDKIIPYKKKEIKKHIYKKKLNITTRNFPETTNQLKSKWLIQDGGDIYCFFATNIKNEKIVIFGNKT